MAAFNSIITDIAPLNVQRPNGMVVIHAKQSDGSSRFYRAEMYDGVTPWNPGDDSSIIKTIRYKKPDGHFGWYDTMEDGTPAVVISGNTVTFGMTEQSLNVAGRVVVDLSFYKSISTDHLKRISTFNILLDVEPAPITDNVVIDSKDYVSVMANAFAAAAALVGATAEANEDYDIPIDEGGVADVNLEGGPDDGTPYKFVFDIPPGKRGPRGYKVSQIVPVSEYHTPGGFDTYKFKTEDGSDVAGTFQVYNGMNGVGVVNSVDGVQPNGTNVQLNALRVPQGSDQVQALTTEQIAKIRKALGIGSMASYDYILFDENGDPVLDGDGNPVGETNNGIIFGDITETQYNTLVTEVQNTKNRVASVETGKMDVRTVVTEAIEDSPALITSGAVYDAVDSVAKVSTTEPTEELNRIWVKPTVTEVEIPTMEDFDDLKSAFDELETTLTDAGVIEQIYKLQTVFNNSTVYSTGTIIDGSLGYNVYVFHVPAGATVAVTGGNNYGLYADVPVKNTTVSVDGTRHVGPLNATPITMPSGANYLAVVNSAEPTVDAIDTATITDRVELLEDKAEDLEDRYTVVKPENFITLSQDNLYGIPSDMEVSISNGTITFSYPYASGNKGNFGIIFDELVNGKSYTLNFDVTSGGLGDVSNIRIVTLDSNKALASLLCNATKTGSHYSCTFIANATAGEPYIALMLAMTRSISTTVTLSNISAIETGETEYTKLKNTYVRDLGQDSFSDDVNEILNSTAKSVKITIANSDKIGYISNSFLNGYTIRGKHAIENISMFSDYLHYNYGKSGDNAVSALIRIENDSSWLGAVPISEWGMKYAVIAMEDNDKAMYQINHATYYQNFKKLCEAVRALGAVPILGTEHDVSGAYYGLESLAREQGIMFMNWGKVANALKCGYFPPFWNNNHPATRTAWLWSNGMKQYLDTLPRPEKSIKLFRVRDDVDTTDLDNLVYNDTVERAERFAEIHVGQKALTVATEKYFDRMDVTGPAWEDVNDEYQTLQAGTDGVSFGSFALVECVTPYDRNGLTNLTMSIESTGVTKAYIKKNKSITLPYNWTTYIAFGVTEGAESLTPNSTFQITGGVFDSSLIGTYTVDSVVNGIVITKTSSSGKTTSGTDLPVCSVSGVTLAGSYTSMSSDYLANYTKPIGEYIEITEFDNDGVTDLTDYLANGVDYDKVSILLTGTSIDIEKIEFNAIGNGEKARAGKALTQRIDGTSILTDTLLDDNTAWNGINEVPKYTPVASTNSSSTIEALPGVTTVRILDDGDSIYQSINTSGLNTNALKTYKLQIRVIARYFPEYIDTDAKWATSEVTETSYDCARLAITIGNNDVCARAEVGAYWNEYIFDVDYISGDKITVACENKSLQIAKVECELIN